MGSTLARASGGKRRRFSSAAIAGPRPQAPHGIATERPRAAELDQAPCFARFGLGWCNRRRTPGLSAFRTSFDRRQIEPLRVEVPTAPAFDVALLWLFRIGHHREEILIAGHIAHVLGRPGASAIDADRRSWVGSAVESAAASLVEQQKEATRQCATPIDFNSLFSDHLLSERSRNAI